MHRRLKSGKPVSRRTLITGGTGSVGQALVRAFSRAGHSVTFQYNSNHRRATALSRRFGAQSVALDFDNGSQMTRTDFDIVINNAAINVCDLEVRRIPKSTWETTLRINLTAPFEVVRQCLPSMIRKKWGRIINISSIYGLRAVEGRAAYTASKHGLSGLTKTLAREYAKFGITANEICPGPIESEMMYAIAEREGGSRRGAAARYLREVVSDIPAGRLLRPEELADLAVFVSSDEAQYLNGASITLDGGMTA